MLPQHSSAGTPLDTKLGALPSSVVQDPVVIYALRALMHDIALLLCASGSLASDLSNEKSLHAFSGEDRRVFAGVIRFLTTSRKLRHRHSTTKNEQRADLNPLQRRTEKLFSKLCRAFQTGCELKENELRFIRILLTVFEEYLNKIQSEQFPCRPLWVDLNWQHLLRRAILRHNCLADDDELKFVDSARINEIRTDLLSTSNACASVPRPLKDPCHHSKSFAVLQHSRVSRQNSRKSSLRSLVARPSLKDNSVTDTIVDKYSLRGSGRFPPSIQTSTECDHSHSSTLLSVDARLEQAPLTNSLPATAESPTLSPNNLKEQTLCPIPALQVPAHRFMGRIASSGRCGLSALGTATALLDSALIRLSAANEFKERMHDLFPWAECVDFVDWLFKDAGEVRLEGKYSFLTIRKIQVSSDTVAADEKSSSLQDRNSASHSSSMIDSSGTPDTPSDSCSDYLSYYLSPSMASSSSSSRWNYKWRALLFNISSLTAEQRAVCKVFESMRDKCTQEARQVLLQVLQPLFARRVLAVKNGLMEPPVAIAKRCQAETSLMSTQKAIDRMESLWGKCTQGLAIDTQFVFLNPKAGSKRLKTTTSR